MPNAPTKRLRRAMQSRRRERDRRAIATGKPLGRYTADLIERLTGATARGDIGRVAGLLASVPDEVNEILGRELSAMLKWSVDSSRQAFVTAYHPVVWAKVLRQRVGISEALDPLEVENELSPILSGAVRGQAARDVLQQVMFDPHSPSTVDRLLMRSNAQDGLPWDRRFKTVAHGDLRQLRSTLVTGISQGKNIAELRPAIDDLVGGVRYKAQRIARTEALRVAEEAQREDWGELGDAMTGVQVFNPRDKNTRHKDQLGRSHWEWAGKVYHKVTDGIFRRQDVGCPPQSRILPSFPAAPNCRCWSSPTMKGDNELPPATYAASVGVDDARQAAAVPTIRPATPKAIPKPKAPAPMAPKPIVTKPVRVSRVPKPTVTEPVKPIPTPKAKVSKPTPTRIPKVSAAEKKTAQLQKQLADQKAKRILQQKELDAIKARTAKADAELKAAKAKEVAQKAEVDRLKAETRKAKAEAKAIDKQLQAQDIAHDEALRKLRQPGVTDVGVKPKPAKVATKTTDLSSELRLGKVDDVFDDVLTSLEDGKGGKGLEEIGLALTGEGKTKVIVDGAGKLRAAVSTEFNGTRVKVLHLGSTGPGGGSRAILEAIDEAIEKNLPLYLESTEDAVGFYRKLGMNEVPGKRHVFQSSPMELRKIQTKLIDKINKQFPKG